MNMVNNIKSFLYDKNYFISMYDNNLYLFNYVKIDSFNDLKIRIIFNNFNLEILGSGLKFKTMCYNELLIEGRIIDIKVIYE